MQLKTSRSWIIVSLLGLITLSLLAGCAAPEPTTVEVTRVVEQTVVVTQISEIIITATPLPPTPTLEATPTPEATAIPVDVTGMPAVSPDSTGVPAVPAVAAQSASSQAVLWCAPKDSIISTVKSVDALPAIPDGAKMTDFSDPKGMMVYPFSGCIFTYNFGQAVPQDAELSIYDQASTPFLKVKLNAVASNPSMGYALVSHGTINEPPAWSVGITLKLASGGNNIWTGSTTIDRGWRAPLCWQGRLPNPVTLACPAWQDTHPDDPGYTPAPKD